MSDKKPGLQAVAFYLVVESRFRNVETLGNKAFIAVISAECLADEFPLKLFGGLPEAEMGETISQLAGIGISTAGLLLEVLGEVLDPDVIFITERGKLQGLVLKLANVAGPGIFNQSVECGSLHGDRF